MMQLLVELLYMEATCERTMIECCKNLGENPSYPQLF